MSEQAGAEILKPFGEYRAPTDNHDVIELLENWLEKARRGEITGLAIAAIAPNDHSVTNWRRGPHSSLALLGLIEALKAHVLVEVMSSAY